MLILPSVPTPEAGRLVKLEPSPTNDVAVSIPVTTAPELVVSNFLFPLWKRFIPPSLIKDARVSPPSSSKKK